MNHSHDHLRAIPLVFTAAKLGFKLSNNAWVFNQLSLSILPDSRFKLSPSNQKGRGSIDLVMLSKNCDFITACDFLASFASNSIPHHFFDLSPHFFKFGVSNPSTSQTSALKIALDALLVSKPHLISRAIRNLN